MQFVEKHLTKHHLLHAPHRWFLALLVSPIHAAQIHYQRKYHLNFRHARKLFFFDMCLLAFLICLFGATLFWHFYDPTVRSLVTLKVEQSTERIQTGTKITYTVSYINRSDVALISPLLSLEFPTGFILNSSTSAQNFRSENSSLELSTLAPGANGSVTLEGTLFGTPDEHYDTIVKLSYIQEGEKTREQVIARLISSPRDTPLSLDWKMGDAVLAHGSLPFVLNLRNTGNEKLEGVRVPLPSSAGVQFQNVSTTLGTYAGTLWSIPILSARSTTTLSGVLSTNLDTTVRTLTLDTTPTLRANTTDFPQKKITKQLTVITPSLEASAIWKKEKATAKPFEVVPLSFTIKNTNEYTIEDVVLNIPLVSGIDRVRLTQNNRGVIRNNNFIVNKTQFPNLASIKRGETVQVNVSIPLSTSFSGSDVTMTLTPEVQASIPQIPGAVYRKKISTTELKIATQLGLTAELRYYTDEGDQLGRGPLPPRVGSETRYFATIVLTNSTSRAEEVVVSATLPAGMEWADKTSVTFGKDVTYNPATRKITWSAPTVPAHTSVGISLALSFTPTTEMIGKTLPALTNITVSGKDAFTGLSLSSSARTVDTSLPLDAIAKDKGVKVEE